MTRSRPGRRTTRTPAALAALAGVVGLGVLAGCGSLQPGVAAEVGGQSLADADADRLSREACDVVRTFPNFPEGGVPRAAVLQFVVSGFVLRATADQMAEDYDVEASASFGQYVTDTTRGLAEAAPDGSDDLVELFTSERYFQEIRDAIGRQQLAAEGAEATVEEATAKGTEVAQSWLSDNGVTIDPRFPDLTLDDSSVVVALPAESDGSAVSETAKQALAQEPSPEYVESLPAAQRCGG